jgi:arsenate reductase
MAVAFLSLLADPAKARGMSAGTQPSDRIHPVVAQAMSEIGVDLSSAVPRLLTPELAGTADLLVTMGCAEECPYVPGVEVHDWNLPDPKDQPIEGVREIRDDIHRRVVALVTARDLAKPE